METNGSKSTGVKLWASLVEGFDGGLGDVGRDVEEAAVPRRETEERKRSKRMVNSAGLPILPMSKWLVRNLLQQINQL